MIGSQISAMMINFATALDKRSSLSTNLINVIGIRAIDLNWVWTQFGIEAERSIEVVRDEHWIHLPFGEDPETGQVNTDVFDRESCVLVYKIRWISLEIGSIARTSYLWSLLHPSIKRSHSTEKYINLEIGLKRTTVANPSRFLLH